MITLAFPSLDKALMKADKEWNDNDPRKGIIVLNENAIVLADQYCFVVNLRDYFTIECGVHEDEEMEELDKILFYMNQKIFNVDFWKEITKGANMRMQNGSLYIENPKYAKDLHYKHVDVDFLTPLANLKKSFNQDENLLSSVAIPFSALQKIYSTMASDFKDDTIIFEFAGQEKFVKFTFRKRKHCFGYIVPHYDSVLEAFRFQFFEDFIESEEIIELMNELKDKLPPAPPPHPMMEVVKENNTKNLFDNE